MLTPSCERAMVMPRLARCPASLSRLPEDVLLEISSYLDVEDIFALCSTNKHLHAFASTRHLWHKATQSLCYRLPLAIPPFRTRASIDAFEFQSIVRRALRLEKNWRSECPTPARLPRYLDLTDDCVMMIRLLPGGRMFILVTADGSLTCRDIGDGSVLGRWSHGGWKVHSIDVDVVDDGQAMILTASIDRHEILPKTGEVYDTHMVHVLRIDVSDDPETGIPRVDFVHIMASPWDSPWWIVSVEGDVIAAYACELHTRPLSQFVVWIANWRTATAAIVHLPETVIQLVNWPTLQVVGGQVVIYEERGCSPASLVFPVPDTLFSTDSADPLPNVKITPSLIQDGDHLDNAYQTRFSKLWRNDFTRAASGRPLSLFAISASTNLEAKRIVSVQTFDPFPMPCPPLSVPKAKPSIPKAKVWRREAIVPEAPPGGLRFTFCLGRYGSFPVWIEEALPEGGGFFPELRLMGLFTEHKDGGSHHPKHMASPDGVDLETLQCLDFDDAEGILCGVTKTGVWIIQYA